MKRRRGSVIIVVLVLITLASLLLARFMVHSFPTRRSSDDRKSVV